MTRITGIRTLSLRSSLFLLLPPFLFCGSACPQESLPSPTSPAARTISPGEMFTFFFLMLGPLKILGPWASSRSLWDCRSSSLDCEAWH